LVDLAVFGRPARLVWSNQRWKCPDSDCTIRTWCEIDERIAPARAAITNRAGRWATIQVGRHGRSVSEVARDLSCDWHAYQVVREIYTINDADTGAAFVARLAADLQDAPGPPEAINNLVKRVKRTAFGMTRFRNYRLRSLLYADKPNWSLLNPTPR
jgi:transposase